MTQAPRGGRLWGIVLAAVADTRVHPFLRHFCGGRGSEQFGAVWATLAAAIKQALA